MWGPREKVFIWKPGRELSLRNQSVIRSVYWDLQPPEVNLLFKLPNLHLLRQHELTDTRSNAQKVKHMPRIHGYGNGKGWNKNSDPRRVSPAPSDQVPVCGLLCVTLENTHVALACQVGFFLGPSHCCEQCRREDLDLPLSPWAVKPGRLSSKASVSLCE